MILVNSGAFLSISSWFSELTELIFVMIPYISSTGYPPTTQGIMGHVQVANSNIHRTDMLTTSDIFQQRVNEAFSMYCDDEDTGKKVAFNKDHMEGMI